MADEKLIDFAAERSRRIHDLHDRKLEEMRQVFSEVLPLPTSKKRKGIKGLKGKR